jgi:hypothetical protein
VTRRSRSVCGEIDQGCGGIASSQVQPRTGLAAIALYAVCSALCAFTGFRPTAASAQEATLVRMLQEGQNFKVRAGAAALIGRSRHLERRPELEGALRDQHPAVRAAAAGGLGRMGSRSSLPPLHDVARHDRVQGVAREARAAIVAIETQPGNPGVDSSASKEVKHYTLVLGEMRNQSNYAAPQLIEMLGRAVERNLAGLPSAQVMARTEPVEPPKQPAAPAAAKSRPLSVFRLDGTVTSLVARMIDGQLSVHCEVSLLVMDQPTGSLRTLLRGAARGVEIPAGERALQELSVASRVVDAAVRSALRNADSVIAQAAREPDRPRAVATNRTAF